MAFWPLKSITSPRVSKIVHSIVFFLKKYCLSSCSRVVLRQRKPSWICFPGERSRKTWWNNSVPDLWLWVHSCWETLRVLHRPECQAKVSLIIHCRFVSSTVSALLVNLPVMWLHLNWAVFKLDVAHIWLAVHARCSDQWRWKWVTLNLYSVNNRGLKSELWRLNMCCKCLTRPRLWMLEGSCRSFGVFFVCSDKYLSKRVQGEWVIGLDSVNWMKRKRFKLDLKVSD